MNISAVKHLYAYTDGDTITPGMGVIIDAGYGLQQYWNPSTKRVVSTDFSTHHATLYPQAYSSKKGTIIVPETTGQQWYYGNISSEGAILEDGAVKTRYASLFEISSVTANGKTYPALIIKNNLANENDLNDKYIYYTSSINGKSFTCQQLIPIQSAVGDAYDVLLSAEGQDGTGDNVLSNDNDWVKFTAYLQTAGQNVASGVSYQFQKLNGATWQNVTNTANLIEITSNTIKLYNAAVEGVEMFRVMATYNGTAHIKVFEVTDIHDPYYIEDGCNIAGDAIAEGERATFNPKVYDRSDGSLSAGWSFSYALTKRSDGSVISGLTVNQLTYENVEAYGGINVRIEASRS